MRVVRTFLLLFLAVQLTFAPVVYGADPITVFSSNSSHLGQAAPTSGDDWLDDLFKKMIALMVVGNSLNWVYYAGASTVIYYKFFYQNSLNIARYARADARREAAKSKLTREQKQDALKDIDSLIKDLEERVAAAEAAIPELDRKIKDVQPLPNHGKKDHGKHFNGVADYAKLVEWMKTPAGEAYLKTPKGAAWKNDYDKLINASTTDVEATLYQILQKANVFYPDDNFQYIVSTHQRPGGRPGEFVAVDDLRPQTTPIQLHDIPGYVKKRVRGRCDEYFASLVSAEKKTAKEASFSDFWLKQGNIKQPLSHALVVLGGLGGTYWLYRATRYGAAHSEAAKRARQKQKVEDDIVTDAESESGRKMMQPFYDIVEQVMHSNRAKILESLRNNLSEDERKNVNLEKVVDGSLNKETLEVALRRAVPFAAKKVQGSNTTLSQVEAMLYTSKSDAERREHIFKPFAKEVFREVFNSLWPELSVGDASENISVGVLRSMLNETASQLEKETRLKRPEGDIEPAPGVPERVAAPTTPRSNLILTQLPSARQSSGKKTL